MNKKGYTLIEVIVSILILSITSLMLASSFGNVIHFMSKANDIKTASNEMYSVAEGKTITNVTQTKRNVSYSINQIPVHGYVYTLTSDTSDEAALHQLTFQEKVIQGGLLKEETFYFIMDEHVDTIFESFNTNLKAICKTSFDTCNYSGVLRDTYIDFLNEMPEFSKNLLPTSMGNKSYYIRIAYPWKYEKGHVPDPIICLSTNIHGSGNMDENLMIVYDYDNKKWYFCGEDKIGIYTFPYGANGMVIAQMNDFALNRDDTVITSWEMMKQHMADPNNGWKYLDKDAVFDNRLLDDITKLRDFYWKDVE